MRAHLAIKAKLSCTRISMLCLLTSLNTNVQHWFQERVFLRAFEHFASQGLWWPQASWTMLDQDVLIYWLTREVCHKLAFLFWDRRNEHFAMTCCSSFCHIAKWTIENKVIICLCCVTLPKSWDFIPGRSRLHCAVALVLCFSMCFDFFLSKIRFSDAFSITTLVWHNSFLRRPMKCLQFVKNAFFKKKKNHLFCDTGVFAHVYTVI